MARRTFLFKNDEGLAKRDDDHKPTAASSWIPKKSQLPSLRKRRLLWVVVACLFIYLFVKNIPQNLGPSDTRYQEGLAKLAQAQRLSFASHQPEPDLPDAAQQPPNKRLAPKGAPPVKTRETILGQTVHNFDGPIKFYYLATSLHGIARTAGNREKNKNILFAASDLKSVSAIVPLACEMSRWKRNYVHFAIMGRDELPMNDIKEINGVNDEGCKIYWHDARPDYAIYSSDHRMEVSIAGAMRHVANFMHPQAVITAGAQHEDAFFTRAMVRKTKELKMTMIQIPQEAPHKLSWMARLDAQSLSSWHAAQIDILVQAPPENSASLIRLLKSLDSADYEGFTAPRLTLELPTNIDAASKRYIENEFEWPPPAFESQLRSGHLVLRRRIPETRVDPEHAAVRFIESFYPADKGQSNVLILSPQTQLSPVFFHTLKYYLLEYKHSEQAWLTAANMFGISLEAPSLYLNGTGPFQPPISPTSPESPIALYLWQAPNSNAGLYFGDKWIEAHSFLTQHLAASRHPATRDHHKSRPKHVALKYPQWVEFFLDLMKTRGYFMLYPSMPTIEASRENPQLQASSLVVVHNELYTPPEEFKRDTDKDAAETPSEIDQELVLEADTSYLASHLAHDAEKDRDKSLNEESALFKNIRPMVPKGVPPHPEDDIKDEDVAKSTPGALPAVYTMKCLNHMGEVVSLDTLFKSANDHASLYRREAGGCSAERAKNQMPVGDWTADDLFCLSDVPEEQLALPQQPILTAALGPSSGTESATATSTNAEEASDSKEVKANVFSAEHATGAAANIVAAKNPAEYQETALAGFKARLEAESTSTAAARETSPAVEESIRPAQGAGAVAAAPPSPKEAVAGRLSHAPEDISGGAIAESNDQRLREARVAERKAAEQAAKAPEASPATHAKPLDPVLSEVDQAAEIEAKQQAEAQQLVDTGRQLPPQVKKEPGAVPPSSGDVTLGGAPERPVNLNAGVGTSKGKIVMTDREAAAAAEAANAGRRGGAGIPLAALKPVAGSQPQPEEAVAGFAGPRGKIRGFDVGGIDDVQETAELKARRQRTAQLAAEREAAGAGGARPAMRETKPVDEAVELEAPEVVKGMDKDDVQRVGSRVEERAREGVEAVKAVGGQAGAAAA